MEGSGISLSHLENVIHPDNVIYKLTDEEDTFVIVKLCKPEELGFHYSSEVEQLPIALFKGLLSSREDIYPLEYLLNPEFIMCQD